MKNNFAEIYSQHEALAARYNEASQKNDREGMEQAREEHRALNEKVAANGRAYARLYELYADARERGNDSSTSLKSMTIRTKRNSSRICASMASRLLPFPPAGRKPLKAHGCSRRTAVRWKAW